MVGMSMRNEPAVDNDFSVTRRSVTHEFMNSVIVVELEIVAAVNNKKAVVRALNKQTHSAVDICMVILESVEHGLAVAAAHRLAVVGNRILPCRYPERTIARCVICRDVQAVLFKQSKAVPVYLVLPDYFKAAFAEPFEPGVDFINIR